MRTDPFRSSGDTARPNRIEVDDHHRVVGTTSTYAIGDVAGGTGPGGAVLPMLASPAMQAGRFVAAEILGSRERPFRYREKGMLATIGRRAAVGQVGPISFTGIVGSVAWLVVHLYYLIGFGTDCASSCDGRGTTSASIDPSASSSALASRKRTTWTALMIWLTPIADRGAKTRQSLRIGVRQRDPRWRRPSGQ